MDIADQGLVGDGRDIKISQLANHIINHGTYVHYSTPTVLGLLALPDMISLMIARISSVIGTSMEKVLSITE
ncbi:hypothetical protein D3C84_1094610 [compost metagenome]